MSHKKELALPPEKKSGNPTIADIKMQMSKPQIETVLQQFYWVFDLSYTERFCEWRNDAIFATSQVVGVGHFHERTSIRLGKGLWPPGFFLSDSDSMTRFEDKSILQEHQFIHVTLQSPGGWCKSPSHKVKHCLIQTFHVMNHSSGWRLFDSFVGFVQVDLIFEAPSWHFARIQNVWF